MIFNILIKPSPFHTPLYYIFRLGGGGKKDNILGYFCHLAADVGRGSRKKVVVEGEKKLLCAVNIEQPPSLDDPCCIQFLPKCFLLNLHQTDTQRTKENLITKGN